jgi:hypothetical protein
MNALKVISIALLMIGALGLIGAMDAEDEAAQDDHYCEMRQIWEQNRDIEPRYRPGWPNFKPEIECPV